MTEASLFSGITSMIHAEPEVWVSPGDTVMMKASGWAWAGGGRNIVHVDLPGDEGKMWTTATLTNGANQRIGCAWAWVFWEAEVPTKVKEDGSVHLVSKAVDFAFNVQPKK
jgi:sulfite oxidase